MFNDALNYFIFIIIKDKLFLENVVEMVKCTSLAMQKYKKM